MRAPYVFVVLLASLAGCDLFGIESTTATAARREAEGKAVGGGCRHAARSLEQCYEQNKRADKAAVFAGWREMNDYMRENKIEAQPPAAEPAPVEVASAEDAESDEGEPTSDAKGGSKVEAGSTKAARAELKGKGDKSDKGKPARR